MIGAIEGEKQKKIELRSHPDTAVCHAVDGSTIIYQPEIQNSQLRIQRPSHHPTAFTISFLGECSVIDGIQILPTPQWHLEAPTTTVA
jgi:hypothetical protein